MPHYKDGTPAEVGDFVKGKPSDSGLSFCVLVPILPGAASVRVEVAVTVEGDRVGVAARWPYGWKPTREQMDNAAALIIERLKAEGIDGEVVRNEHDGPFSQQQKRIAEFLAGGMPKGARRAK